MNNFLEKLHTSIVENISSDGTSFLKTLNTLLTQGGNENLAKIRLFSGEEYYLKIQIINKKNGEIDFQKINLSQSLTPDITSYTQTLTDKEVELFSDITSYLEYFLH